jgi:SAM-dependent methyltransferase
MPEGRVQFGCGLCAPAGWRNFDSSPTLRLQRVPVLGALVPSGPYGRFPSNVEYGDIVRGLPLPANYARLLYSSHVLEHLALQDLRRALQNCHRVMGPGGTFRMVLPDLERLVANYSSDPSPDAGIRFMTDSILGRQTRSRGFTGFFRDWLGNSQHLWMWDYRGLAHELGAVGFQHIRRATFGDSQQQDFWFVESADRWNFNLGIECTK